MTTTSAAGGMIRAPFHWLPNEHVVSLGSWQSMEETESGVAPSGGAPLRTIRDEEGQSWTVREYVRRRNGSEDRSLLFDCGMAIRRVRDFPERWLELDDDELLRVSRRR